MLIHVIKQHLIYEYVFLMVTNFSMIDVYLFQGDTIASCDSKGVVKLWDVRTIKSLVTLDFGPYSANSVSFHPAGREMFVRQNEYKTRFLFPGQLLTTASSDRTIKLYNIASEQVT